MKRRTEVTIETDRVVVFGGVGNKRAVFSWCQECDSRVQMLTTDEAALTAGVNSKTIFHWAESGRLHSVETNQGLLLICSNSLKAQH